MPEFTCRVGTPGGEVRVETHVARDEESLRQDLARRDLHVFELRSRRPSLRIGGLRVGGGAARVPRRQFLLFNHELVVLLRAGLPLLQALDVLLERMPEGAFRRYLTDIRDRVRGGAALSEAFQAQGEAFPRVYAASLTAGERSGELPAVLARYVAFAQRTEKIRSRVRAAMIYPMLLSFMSVGLICLLMFYILPKFSAFYLEFGQELPGITLFVIGIAKALQAQGPLLAVVLAVTIIGSQAWNRTARGRRFFDRLKLRVPVAGTVARMYNIAQLCRTLSTLLAGGIPLVSALQTTSGALSNQAFIDAVGKMADDVREGSALWDSIEHTGVTSDLTIEMVKVGEATGALSAMLASVADFYDDQLDDAMTRIVSLFEPILLIVMGMLVAFILLAMYLPIFRLAGGGI